MLALTLSLPNPFPKVAPGDGDETVFEAGADITEHKGVYAELAKGPAINLLSVDLDLSFTGHDHAGPMISLQIWGWTLTFGVADDRHWDYAAGAWGDVCEGHGG